MLGSPDSCASRLEDLPHRVDKGVLGKGFQKEGIGSRLSGAAGGGQDAEDNHGDVARSGVRLEPATERQPVQVWNENLSDDDVRENLPSLLQDPVTILREPNGVTGLIQEVRLELADVRIAIDDENDRLPFFC
jgi:hypothetical protein